MITPLKLPANQPADRFYRGGARIAAFRSDGAAGVYVPEDWVASTTTLHGEESLGWSRTSEGELLIDLVTQDPDTWLGAAHASRWGADTKLLTKLLDAGQRLPVHVHPDTDFAARHLGTAHGKTEAWVFLRGGTVHLGWAVDVAEPILRQWVQVQDVDSMLAAMHAFDVNAGDAVLVPAGTPHAIGQGCFIVEVQEPEDLSILLEWVGFDINGSRDGHLGLGFDLALQAVDRAGTPRQEIEAALIRRRRDDATGPMLPAAATDFFRVDHLTGPHTLPAGFAVLIVTDGHGQLSWSGGQLDAGRGDTIVVPAAAGELSLGEGLTALACRPPQA